MNRARNWSLALLRRLLALGMLPLAAAVTGAVVSLVGSVESDPDLLVPWPALSLGTGFVLWIVIFLGLPQPVRTYVLAHELTHALWAAVMGARVGRMRVSRDGGSVVVSRTNVLITLSPYFFPLYTVLLCLAYPLLGLWLDLAPYEWLWLALVGFTWGFHLTFTVTSLLERQTDLLEYGWFFSLVVIYLLNLLGIGLWVVAVSSATVLQFADRLAVWTRIVYGALLQRVLQ